MPNIAVVGGQWGDEGKGKVVDLVSSRFDVVARYQGGPNAGHTVVLEGRRQIYFNTGTWRKFINPVQYDRDPGREFIPWQVMTYVIFYKDGECHRPECSYRYEMWQGMRGGI